MEMIIILKVSSIEPGIKSVFNVLLNDLLSIKKIVLFLSTIFSRRKKAFIRIHQKHVLKKM
jgi:hypothetical protein